MHYMHRNYMFVMFVMFNISTGAFIVNKEEFNPANENTLPAFYFDEHTYNTSKR